MVRYHKPNVMEVQNKVKAHKQMLKSVLKCIVKLWGRDVDWFLVGEVWELCNWQHGEK